MLYALSWLVIFSLLALWSLAAWAVHAVAVWTLSNAGALTGAASGFEGLRPPEWLAPWVPPEIVQAMTSQLSGLVPAVEGLLQSAPALAGGLGVTTWVIWGLGSALLVLMGAGLHLFVAIWRRRGGGSGPLPRPQVVARRESVMASADPCRPCSRPSHGSPSQTAAPAVLPVPFG